MRRYRARFTFGWRWCQGPVPAGCAALCWRPGEMGGQGVLGSGAVGPTKLEKPTVDAEASLLLSASWPSASFH